MIQQDALKISVDDDFKYLQLEPFLKAEVEDLLQTSPSGGKVSLALERQPYGAEAKIHYNHPAKQFHVKAEGQTPFAAIEHALNRFESILSAWIDGRGYSHSSLTISTWTKDQNSEKTVLNLLHQSALNQSHALTLSDPELSLKIEATDVIICEWPSGARFLKAIEGIFHSVLGRRADANFPKPVILLLNSPTDSFQFERSPWFFPIGTVAKTQSAMEGNQRLEKYLDFVLRNKTTH